MVDRSDVRVGPEPGLEQVVAEGPGDVVRRVAGYPMGLCGETDITKVGRHNLLMPGWPSNL